MSTAAALTPSHFATAATLTAAIFCPRVSLLLPESARGVSSLSSSPLCAVHGGASKCAPNQLPHSPSVAIVVADPYERLLPTTISVSHRSITSKCNCHQGAQDTTNFATKQIVKDSCRLTGTDRHPDLAKSTKGTFKTSR